MPRVLNEKHEFRLRTEKYLNKILQKVFKVKRLFYMYNGEDTFSFQEITNWTIKRNEFTTNFYFVSNIQVQFVLIHYYE